LRYWDDDLLGYMRAASKKESAREKKQADTTRGNETPTEETLTRVSPLRVSTLVSVAPVTPTDDFGVMARHDGNPVPHEHQFYRTALKGLLSLDLYASGTFSYRQKNGFSEFRYLSYGRSQAARFDTLGKDQRISLASRRTYATRAGAV
jgi:CRISPR-associated protein Cst2